MSNVAGMSLALPLILLSLVDGAASAFVVPASTSKNVPLRTSTTTVTQSSNTALSAGAPSRLDDNTEGVLYVNDKCIDCSACQYFAPSVFKHSNRHGKHVVHKQPNPMDTVELDQARAALSACPVAAIRVENTAKSQHKGGSALSEEDEGLAKKLAISPKLNGLSHPFPRTLTDNVWFVGHHNEDSFGATPFLVRGNIAGNKSTTVLVDTPKFGPSAVRTITSITGPDGPDYLLLSHVDDTADHNKWHEQFPNMKRIFHEGDLGRHNWIGDETLGQVEVLLKGKSNDDDMLNHDSSKLKAWRLDGTDVSLGREEGRSDSGGEEEDDEFVVLHTPGHSPGSISLLYTPRGGGGNKKSTLFTGDTLAYSTRVGGLSGFPRYGNNLKLQSHVLETLLDLPRLGYDWTVIAPGHGRYQVYGDVNDDEEDRSDEDGPMMATTRIVPVVEAEEQKEEQVLQAAAFLRTY